MGRPGVRLLARAMVALWLAACVTGGASATAAGGGKTIAQAPSIKLNAPTRGRLYDGAFYSGYSVAFWTGSFAKGDRISIRTTASRGDTPRTGPSWVCPAGLGPAQTHHPGQRRCVC